MPKESIDQDKGYYPEMQRLEAAAAPSSHGSPAPQVSAPPVLQVSIERLDEWRADVAKQRQVAAHAQAAYAKMCEALDQCSPGGAGWGELRRKPRYLQHQLEDEQRKLAQLELFVSLIEHGSSKDAPTTVLPALHPESSALHGAPESGSRLSACARCQTVRGVRHIQSAGTALTGIGITGERAFPFSRPIQHAV